MKSSGILLHITSLPSSSGVGTLAEVDKFIDFLQASNQHYWQILPITPTDYVNSPYSSPSAFAGNTLLIDADSLCKEGLISQNTLFNSKTARGNDYQFAKQQKEILLREAFANFCRLDPTQDYLDFVETNAYWLDDYALFCALKTHFGGKSWLEWEDEEIRCYNKSAVQKYSDVLSDEINYHVFCQYVFDKQWKEFRSKLSKANVKLIGDIPIYVACDSADVWAHGNLFKLTQDKKPSWVAGVPPDYFSKDGQLWGNPLYNWKEMSLDNYGWWTKRVGKCAQMFDVLRIDHFRAFDSYYCIKYGKKNARVGHWTKGVGYKFIKHLQTSYPSLTIIAEDLGDIPQSVIALRNKCGLAGMKVVQFAFDGNPNNSFLPQNFEEHCVAYLGTHDNDTTVGWFDSLSYYDKQRVIGTMGYSTDKDLSLQLITSLFNSNAELVIVSMQDIAQNDTSCRMNTPGTLGCWKYMANRTDFCSANAKWLQQLTQNTNRCN